jgi:hypothetical protein
VNDFEDEQVFEGVGTYTAIIGLNYDIGGVILSDSGPIECLAPDNTPKNDYTVLGGIATNADGVFIIDGENIDRIDDEFVYLKGSKTISGTTIELGGHKLEKHGCAKMFKLTKMEKNYICVCPYNDEWEIVGEEEIPFTIEYLSMFSDVLNLRDGGNKKYDAWYAYARRQGFHHISGEVVVVPGMVGGSCIPFKTILDSGSFSKICFTSGHVVMGGDLDPLISESFLNHVQSVGKPFAGGWVNVSKSNIRSFNV